MKKDIFGIIMVALVVVLLGVQFAMTQTEVAVKTKTGWAPTHMRLTTAGSATWNLATIEADTDSCVFSSVFDLSTANALPKDLLLRVSWSGATGGSTTTNFGVTLYGHGASTATAGSNATQFDNRIPLGAWQVAPNDTATVNCKATASGEAILIPMSATSPYDMFPVIPRYASVAIQKEGNGKFTAGTVTVEFFPYHD